MVKGRWMEERAAGGTVNRILKEPPWLRAASAGSCKQASVLGVIYLGVGLRRLPAVHRVLGPTAKASGGSGSGSGGACLLLLERSGDRADLRLLMDSEIRGGCRCRKRNEQ